MKLNTRKLLESDWEFLPQWWKDFRADPFPKDFLPENGLGGFMVHKGETNIAAMWLWFTNSKTAIPAVVISNFHYREDDRSDALQLLVDFTTDYAEEKGYKYAFAWAKEGKMLKYYQDSGYYMDNTPSRELIMKF